MAENPLAGKKIVVTRARAQAGGLAAKIEQLGGEVIEFPTIEIRPPAHFTDLDAALNEIAAYDWVIFTSTNTVAPFLGRLEHAGKTVADLAQLHIAAIGSETARSLEAAGVSVALIPARFQAEGILDSLDAQSMSGKRVLIPRAAQAREVLPETLKRWGAKVDVVEAYRTVAPIVDTAALKRRLMRGEVDVITFTSSSTVSHFVGLFGAQALASIAGDAAIACIGPITAKTVEESGGRVAIMAREFTMDGLVQAIVDYFSSADSRFPAKRQRAQSSEN